MEKEGMWVLLEHERKHLRYKDKDLENLEMEAFEPMVTIFGDLEANYLELEVEPEDEK